MTSLARLSRALPIILATLVASSASYAQDDTAKLEQAKPSFTAGREAREAGRYLEALRLFQESDAIYRSETLGALYNIALCEENLKRTAAAYLHYREFLRNVKTTSEQDDRLAPAQAAIRAMEASASGIRFVGLLELPPRTTTLLDDVPLGPLTSQTDYPAEPGKHIVVVRESERPAQRFTVMVALDKRAQVDVRPVPGEPGRPLRTVGFVLGGVGLGSMLAGAITGSLALAKYNDLSKQCGGDKCTIAVDQNEVDRGQRLTHASTATFVIGGALVAAGVTMILLTPSKSKEVALAPLVLPAGGGFAIGGRF